MKSKKDFSNAINPAMQFITPRGDEAGKGLPQSDPGYVYSEPRTPPPGFRQNPAFIEKKTRRMQLLVRPSLYDRLKAQAEAGGVSVNELIDRILSENL